MLTNSAAEPGDALVLTKPIGLGVISTAVKRGGATAADLATAIDVMTTLNAGHATPRSRSACTRRPTSPGSGCSGTCASCASGRASARCVAANAVPVIAGVRELLAADMVAGGTRRNHAFVAPEVDFGDLPESEQLLLCDAQTSGGLLLAVPARAADDLVAALRARAGRSRPQ